MSAEKIVRREETCQSCNCPESRHGLSETQQCECQACTAWVPREETAMSWMQDNMDADVFVADQALGFSITATHSGLKAYAEHLCADSILITREQLEGFWRGAITLQLTFGVRSGECRTCDKVVKYEGASSAPILEHSANCPIPELNKTVAFLARALGEKRG